MPQPRASRRILAPLASFPLVVSCAAVVYGQAPGETFPIVLTTENELPPAYQISVYPTYLVINPDGRLAAAAEGGDGLRANEKLLKKAGMVTN